MSPKQQRLRFVLGSMVVLAVAVTLMLNAFRDNLVFFMTPTQWQEKSAQPNWDKTREIRLGGLVGEGSLRTAENGSITFTITDLTHEVRATYRGIIPSLFREGQGVVAQGSFDAAGLFHARTILAKHDENYMPKEVVDALKQSGRWQQK